MSHRTVTVLSRDGYETVARLRLGERDYGEGKPRHGNEIGTGCFATALWIGRKYVVLRTYSQWAQRDGSVTGDQYRLCDADDARMIRRVFGDEAAERALDVLRVPVVSVDGEAVSP